MKFLVHKVVAAPSPIRVVAGALIRDGRILLAERPAGGAYAGYWGTPGGKVEDGETDEAALAREWREECDIAIHVGDCLGDALVDTVHGPARVVMYRVDVVGGHEVGRWLRHRGGSVMGLWLWYEAAELALPRCSIRLTPGDDALRPQIMHALRADAARVAAERFCAHVKALHAEKVAAGVSDDFSPDLSFLLNDALKTFEGADK